MRKYKISIAAKSDLESAKNPHELRNVLNKHFPDAFINWDIPVCNVGDTLSRKKGEKLTKYKVIKTADNRAALLYLGSSTLWKHFSETKVGVFNTVSMLAFSEMTNGMKIESFKIEKRKR